MRVGDPKVLVKALAGGQVHPIGPDSEVPLPHGSSGVAQRLQHLSDRGLVQWKTPYGTWVQNPWVDPRAGLVAPSQQRCPGEGNRGIVTVTNQIS